MKSAETTCAFSGRRKSPVADIRGVAAATADASDKPSKAPDLNSLTFISASLRLKRRKNLLRPRLRHQELLHRIALVRRVYPILALPPADDHRCRTGCIFKYRDHRYRCAVPLIHRAAIIHLSEDIGRELVDGAYPPPYRDFNGITTEFGSLFILRIDKILMKPKYYDNIINGVKAKDWPNVLICHGNRDVNQQLLAQRFDFIFFTGSPALGKIVMEAAAAHLTPVVLELGGKSPCIVDQDADIPTAARRIVWGKTLNSGQTCVAPDYLLVHENVKKRLLTEMQTAVIEFFGTDPQKSEDYPHIVSDKAMQRLVGYLKEGGIVMGGVYDEKERYIAPTIIENLPEDAALWQEEIFGPIFPLKTFSDFDEMLQFVQQREKPLALYYFSTCEKKIKRIIRETSSGGVCINDVLLHVGTHHIPFGGIGNSGMGNYHGKYGFETFSHQKSIVTSHPSFDIKIKYPPYQNKLKILKRVW